MADQPMTASTRGGPPSVQQVGLTPEAAQMLRRLRAEHGPLMFHQSGGCCDGSSPMCFPAGEFITGDADVHLADLDVGGPEQVPFWMSRVQHAYWSHTHLTVDLVPGRGAGFSVEAPTGFRFLIRSRLFTDEEAEQRAAERLAAERSGAERLAAEQ
jgi:uncharacterized protein (DUF779 family)